MLNRQTVDQQVARLRYLTLLVTLVVVVVACATSSAPQSLSFEDIATLNGPDRQVVQQVHQEKIAACMEEAGFEYEPYVPPAADTEPFPVETVAQIPVRAHYEEYGYGMAESIRAFHETQSNDPNVTLRGALSSEESGAYFSALHGEVPGPGSGCVGTTEDPGYAALIERHRSLLGRTGEQLFSDAGYQELESLWAECMAASGYQVASRVEGVAEHFESERSRLMEDQDEQGTESLLAREIAMARADSECVEPIEDELRALAEEHQERLVEQFRPLLDDIERLQEKYNG